MDSDKTTIFTRRSVMKMTAAALVLPTVPVSAQNLEKRRMFTPTFVDLVRNYTTTTGVGPFALGAAISGYRSFADAVKPGESFYYSATGIDKPAEFEVGRGTMQPDGTITREPIGGAATDFSTGYKAVALVAASEWFQAVQAGTAAAPVAVPSRDAIAVLTDHSKPALLHEAGREGIFLFNASDHSAQVAADTERGMYIAPATAPTGASGSWVRTVDGAINAAWFGTAGDGATNDYAALNAALTMAASHATAKTVQVAAGVHSVQGAPLSVPDGVTIEGVGPDTTIVADDAAVWAFYMKGRTGATIRNMKVEGSNNVANGVWRSGIKLDNCVRCRVENVVATPTASTLLYMWDCDYCVADTLHYDGGAGQNYYCVYAVGCIGCKIVNSTALNCNQGFGLSGAGTDPTATTRSIEQAGGNTITNCYVRNCKTQAFNINSSTRNTVSNCHAEDYAGTSVHKAFQVKDAVGSEHSSRGNVFSGCTVKNYPAGFGVVRAAGAQFTGCTGLNLSTNGIELVNAENCQFIGFELDEFRQAGIWTSSGTTGCRFDNISLETSTVTAKGIMITSNGGTDSDNSFDNVTTHSTLAAFADIAAIARYTRFGPGCRSNGQPIIDASPTTYWPSIHKTGLLDLTSSGQVEYGPFMNNGLHVARMRFVVTAAISGSPTVSAGRHNSTAAIAAPQAVSGDLGAAVTLAQSSQLLDANSIIAGCCTAAGTAGEGFIQYEGLYLN